MRGALTAVVGLLMMGGGGCDCNGDGDGDPVDAAAVDAEVADAAIDAPPALRTATITIVEGAVLAPAPAPANTIVAQGIQLGVNFTDPATAVQPILDTSPGTLFGCKVTELTPAQIAAAAGVDEGSVTFTVENGGAPANPIFPPCGFVPGGVGYVCPDPASSQAVTAVDSVRLDQVNAQMSLLTVAAGSATFDAADVGRHIRLSGTGSPFDAPHAVMPIVGLGASQRQVFLGAPVPVSVTLVSGMLTTLAGAGPQPGLPDPGRLVDSASATAVLTPGGGNHFPPTTITYANVGDDFTMNAASADLMRTIPTDGTDFSIGCDTCGTSIGTVLTITTTDGSVAGLPPTAMPAPMTKRVIVRCAEVGATTITVPANVSGEIASSGATRIQATFVRATFGTPNPANPGLSGVIAGHALIGFTTP
jgi:hypothetical protein